MTSPVMIRPVLTQKDKRAFLDVPFPIYRDDPNWVAPLYLERFEHLDAKKNPYFNHADVQLFVAERDGKPVGRISAQIDRLHLERYKDETGQFGFIEAIDDPEVFRSLFAAAETWLKQRRMKAVRGPFSFSINDETGLLIDGFDTPPSMMMGHHRPFYLKRIEEQGYAKAKDVIAYDYDGTVELPPKLKALYKRAFNSADITYRPLDKKNMARDVDIIMSIFNDAWSDNWGFVPFTSDEVTTLGKNLKMLVSEPYVVIASHKGEPAAMSVTLPNINEWIVGLDGKLLPFGWAKVAHQLLFKHPKSIRMPLMGVRKKYQSSITGTALALGVIDTIQSYHMKNGTTHAELSWILEDNMGMRRIIEALGGKPYKTYRVFEKALA